MLLQQVKENVSETIGVPFEIIAIDNSGAKQGICAVYNQGTARAMYDILCFMHEDISIKTGNWGRIVISLFNDHPDLGLLGVAGSGYKALAPSGWESFGAINLYINIIQSYKYKKREPERVCINPTNEKLPNVACVDGVWLCTKKSIALEFPFDENLFLGFHCYDIDFSFLAGQKYKVAVTYDVLINHFSDGGYNKTWIDENLKLYKKWNHLLPLNKQGLTVKESIKAEKITFKKFTDQLIEFNYPAKTAYTLLRRGGKYWGMSMKLFIKLSFYVFKSYLKPAKV